jgi:hypothetical protein
LVCFFERCQNLRVISYLEANSHFTETGFSGFLAVFWIYLVFWRFCTGIDTFWDFTENLYIRRTRRFAPRGFIAVIFLGVGSGFNWLINFLLWFC